jgi:hypothetical protein
MATATNRPLAKDGADGEAASSQEPANGATTSSPASSDTLQSFTLDDLAQYTLSEMIRRCGALLGDRPWM